MRVNRRDLRVDESVIKKMILMEQELFTRAYTFACNEENCGSTVNFMFDFFSKTNKDVLNNGSAFAVGLGYFFCLLRYYPNEVLSDEQILKYVIEVIRFLKTVDGFDFNVVTKRLKQLRPKFRENFDLSKKLEYLIRESTS